MAGIDSPMEFQHVNVKVFVEGELPFDPSRFINVFHTWIQEGAMGELLIDVADYCHVPDGPGVLLVGHEADYSMDHTDGRWGLRYNRKAPFAGSNGERFKQALCAAASACLRLEDGMRADGPLRFSRTEFEVFINDRAMGPNQADVFSVFQADLRACLASLLGPNDVSLRGPGDPRRRLGAVISASRPVDLPAIQALAPTKP